MSPDTYINSASDTLKSPEQSMTRKSYTISDASMNKMLYRNSRAAIIQLKSLDVQEVEQLEISQKYQLLKHIGFAMYTIDDLEDANEAYDRAIELAESSGEVWGMMEGYIDAAGVKIALGQLSAAQHLLDRAERLLHSFNRISFRQYLKVRQGQLHFEYYSHDVAQEYFLEALKIADLVEDRDTKSFYFEYLSHKGLGLIHSRNGSHIQAIKAFYRAFEIVESEMITIELPIITNLLTQELIANQEHETAKPMLQKVMNSDIEIVPKLKADLLSKLGCCELQSGTLDVAAESLQKAKSALTNVGGDHSSMLFDIHRRFAELHIALADHQKTAEHFKLALQYAKQVRGFKSLSDVYSDISSFYSEIGSYKEAYEYATLHNQAMQKYFEEVSDQKRYELEIKYEMRQKEQEAEVLRLQSVQLQLKALRAQMNPHFIYNALNAIQHFISSDQNKDAAKYLAKFALLMRKSLDYSDVDKISLEEEIEFIRNYLDINKKLRFDDQMSFDIDVDDSLEEDLLGVPSMIIQPYVENAIEHGIRMKEGKGRISISFNALDAHHIQCNIEDNGIGRKAASAYKAKQEHLAQVESKGTAITEERLQLINKTISRSLNVRTTDLYDNEGKARGTRVEIKIPLIDLG